MVIHKNEALVAQSLLQRRLDMLIRQHLGTTIYAVSQQMGKNRNSLTRAVNGNKSVSSEQIEDLLAVYPQINVDWLFTGRGVPLFDEAAPGFREPETGHGTSAMVRVVHAHQYVGYAARHQDPEFLDSLPGSYIPINEKGTFRDFEISGQALTAADGRGLPDRDIIRCQLIPRELASQSIRPGSAVVAVTKDHVLIRVLAGINSTHIVLGSLNPLYGPEELLLSRVQELWVYRSLQSSREINFTNTTPA